MLDRIVYRLKGYRVVQGGVGALNHPGEIAFEEGTFWLCTAREQFKFHDEVEVGELEPLASRARLLWALGLLTSVATPATLLWLILR